MTRELTEAEQEFEDGVQEGMREVAAEIRIERRDRAIAAQWAESGERHCWDCGAELFHEHKPGCEMAEPCPTCGSVWCVDESHYPEVSR